MVVVFIVLLISSFVMAMENLSQRALQNQLFDFKINIVFSMIQGDKERQEDMVYVPTSINEDHLIVAAVFDGNGRIGQEAIEKDLVSRLIRYCNQSNINDTNPKMSIKEIFMLINNELGDVQEEISKNNEYPHTDNFFSPWHTAGSTALVLFRIPKKEQLVIGWCGDSEAIWSEDGQLKNIEPAHRLKKCVGQYFFYRSFGNSIANDPDRSRFVKDSGCQMSAEPDSIIINNPRGVQFILMATDGLWTYSSKEEVFDFINQCLKQGTLGPLNLGNQDIVNRIMLLSILNDVKHNLVNKWFQFFFKEYIRIIFPGLRQKNVRFCERNLKK